MGLFMIVGSSLNQIFADVCQFHHDVLYHIIQMVDENVIGRQIAMDNADTS